MAATLRTVKMSPGWVCVRMPGIDARIGAADDQDLGRLAFRRQLLEQVEMLVVIAQAEIREALEKPFQCHGVSSTMPTDDDGSPEMTEELLYDKRGEIGWVTFNRPQARNALTFAMYEGLAEICGRIGKTARGQGAGDHRRAATRPSPPAPTSPSSRASRAARTASPTSARWTASWMTIERCPVPTIAAVAGFCTGGGAAIAAVCDLRIASASAQFGFPIARTLGNCLSMANYARLAALIGPQRVKEMMLLAKLIDAPTALA